MSHEVELVRAAAERLLASQQARWGLECELVEWAQAADEIRALRASVYREKLPHMLAEGDPTDQNDARAYHFLARQDGKAVAAARLLPPPFEAEALFPGLQAHLRADGKYIEIGRMVVDPEANTVGASRLLSLWALVWGLTHTDYDAVLAYARERTTNHFRMLGLEVVDRIDEAPGRAEQPYVLMVGHREHTLANLSALA